MAKAPTDSEESLLQFWAISSADYGDSVRHAQDSGLRVQTVDYLLMQRPGKPEDPSIYVFSDADVIFVDCLIDADKILKIANSNKGKLVIAVYVFDYQLTVEQFKKGKATGDILIDNNFRVKRENHNKELDKFKSYLDRELKGTKKYPDCMVLMTEEDISETLGTFYKDRIYNYNPETGWEGYNEQQLVFTNKFDDVKDKMDLFDKEGTIVLVSSKKSVEIPSQIPQTKFNLSTITSYNTFLCTLMNKLDSKDELKRVVSKKSEEKKKEEKKVEESKPKPNYPIDIRLVRIRHNPIKKS